ncbi:MAG: hypothetical protein J6A54_02145 [Clostridia bacterium]|nr:hypothetical protein [Clostridia bacterium]
MRKVFVVICRAQENEFLNIDKDTLFFSPIYEHTYRKFADAVKYVGLDCEIVRSATYTLEGVSTELNCNIEDIIIFTHPLAFLAKRECIEDAIYYVNSHDLAYATIGSVKGLYATIGTGKMLLEDTVSSPYDFIKMIGNCGAVCETKGFGDEVATPETKLEYIRRRERYREEFLDYLCEGGVKIDLRDGVVVSPTATIGEGTIILPNTQICGHSIVGKNCMIGPNAVVSGSIVCDGCVVDSSYVYASTIEKEVEIGPLCHISGSCHLLTGSRVFAYTKLQSVSLGAGSKIYEHCTISDTDVGARVIIGSAVNTVNYDGRKSFECKIADDAFVGSAVNLIAPLTLGAGSYVAAGSTITDDIAPGALGIAREYQSNHDNWARRRKR